LWEKYTKHSHAGPLSERALIVIVPRSSFAVLTAIASLVSAGCRPATNAPPESLVGQNQADNGAALVRDASNDSDLVYLLKSRTVQKDLNLTADQIRQVRDDFIELREAPRREFREGLEKLQNSKIKDSKAKERAFQELFVRKYKELQEKLLATLTPGQNQRLKQIELQTSVLAALNRPEIIEALNLSESQVTKIRALHDEVERGLPYEATPRELDPEKFGVKMLELEQSLRAGAEKSCFDVLTEDQRAGFDRLSGEKIDMEKVWQELSD
jgi:Spy/CpxP family protein refolding chaperone